MKKSCLYFDKKYKCVSFIVHYKGLTLSSNRGLGAKLLSYNFLYKKI